MKTIRNMANLCDHFGADLPRELNRRVYKDTDCGASLSVYLPDGEAIHCGSQKWNELSRKTPIRGFTLQTIVEGSNATVDSDEFVLPVSTKSVGDFIEYMEKESEILWEQANGPERVEDCGEGDANYPCGKCSACAEEDCDQMAELHKAALSRGQP